MWKLVLGVVRCCSVRIKQILRIEYLLPVFQTVVSKPYCFFYRYAGEPPSNAIRRIEVVECLFNTFLPQMNASSELGSNYEPLDQ